MKQKGLNVRVRRSSKLSISSEHSGCLQAVKEWDVDEAITSSFLDRFAKTRRLQRAKDPPWILLNHTFYKIEGKLIPFVFFFMEIKSKEARIIVYYYIILTVVLIVKTNQARNYNMFVTLLSVQTGSFPDFFSQSPLSKRHVNDLLHFKPSPTDYSYGGKQRAVRQSLFLPLRRPKQRQRPSSGERPAPSYPPFDPFGNTAYIPLPVSRPEYALPLQGPTRPRQNRFRPSFVGEDNFFFGRQLRHVSNRGKRPSRQVFPSNHIFGGPSDFGYESSEEFVDSDLFSPGGLFAQTPWTQSLLLLQALLYYNILL